MLPQAVQYQCRFVFLDGELGLAIAVDPGMPAASPRTIWIVFVQQIAARC